MHDRQHHYWNDPRVADDLRSKQSGITDFARDVERLLPRGSDVLELGCSAGDDAAHFATHGHHVVALDVSEPLIDIAAQRFANISNLNFAVRDIRTSFPVGGQSIDCVYARLSLHYFAHEVTLSIFGEIAWVLRAGGTFHFACRSTDDPLYGKGTEIEPDVFVYDGHVRHFFSRDYAAELLDVNGFTILDITGGQQRLYGERGAYVKASATVLS